MGGAGVDKLGEVNPTGSCLVPPFWTRRCSSRVFFRATREHLDMIRPGDGMKQKFTARTWKEDEWIIAQCAEVDVASHGRTEQEALSNLQEALELHFEPPTATVTPRIVSIEVELGAA